MSATGDGDVGQGWQNPNIPGAIGISIGAGLATAVGGAMVFLPGLWSRIPQSTVLAVSLSLSAGVMLYVSFIEIFAKSRAAISSVEGMSNGAATAITTVCFFAGMGVTCPRRPRRRATLATSGDPLRPRSARGRCLHPSRRAGLRFRPARGR